MTTQNNKKSDTAFDISSTLLKRLADTMTRAELTEIEFVDGDRAVRLTRGSAPALVPAATQPAAVPVAPAQPKPVAPMISSAPAEPEPDSDVIDPDKAVKSPMVGTAYLSPEPGKPAFVSVGDKVAKGQTLMIIEAMKVMNPLPSPADGVIKKIMAADGEPVEFDQAVVVLA